MKKKWFIFLTVIILPFTEKCTSGKKDFSDILATANYDEEKVPPYTLPDPFVCLDGSRVHSPAEWWNKRRPELLELFKKEMYGRVPERQKDTLIFVIHKIKYDGLGGKAIMKEVDLFFTPAQDTHSMRILVIIPAHASGPVPCFVSLNFRGNMGICADTFISMNTRWMVYNEFTQVVPVEKRIRGKETSRWPLEMIIDSGYALATAYYGDIDPDYDDGFKNGIHPLFYHEGQTHPAADEWGSIAAWAWGMSRMADYLENEEKIDRGKIIAIGHSRLGKTALWAGACDQRFAIVISNNSGCGGAALSKRIFGETVYILNEIRPHWFCDNFVKYNHYEELLPFDQHELIALIAPRPVYVASATEDLPADPKGEFLSLLHADTVYKFLGTEGLPVKEMPLPGQPVMGTLGYHLRTGKHDITPYDWQQYIIFCNRHFKRQCH